VALGTWPSEAWELQPLQQYQSNPCPEPPPGHGGATVTCCPRGHQRPRPSTGPWLPPASALAPWKAKGCGASAEELGPIPLHHAGTLHFPAPRPSLPTRASPSRYCSRGGISVAHTAATALWILPWRACSSRKAAAARSPVFSGAAANT